MDDYKESKFKYENSIEKYNELKGKHAQLEKDLKQSLEGEKKLQNQVEKNV